ncbi:MAG: FN3 associated domain-containing protein, partial [Verrucomicrobiota bacterium]
MLPRCLGMWWIWAWLSVAWVQATTNLALLKPITGTGPTWPGYPPANLTDGDRNTFTHPQADTAVKGYYFQVDLGAVYSLDHIDLYGRADGCCPERLTGYRVEIYADRGGETGPLNWAADFRMDGSHPPSGGSDTIRATSDPTGTFSGRFVRIVNQSGAPYAPQLAEIEVFGAPGPRILQFEADDDSLAPGAATTLRWRTDGATRVTLEPGPGTVPTNGTANIRPEATTRYTLRATSASGATTAEVIVGVGVSLKPPVIAEFLADNRKGLRDDDGDPSDWIELHNPNPYRLNVDGFHLTDDPAQPTRWKLPAVRIPALGRLVVLASGKDRRDPALLLHTNFKLSAAGDTLSLIAPDGTTLLQRIPADYPATKTFPAQRPDISYGLGTNGTWGFFRVPTPGETNGASFAGIVADTAFSVDRGFQDAPISVAITTTTPGAVIRYTLDRSTPGPTNGSIYSGPITLSNTTTLRAAAFRDGWSPTDVDSHTYLFPADILSHPLMRTSITKDPTYAPQLRAALTDLPSISLATRETINDTTEVRTSFEWIRGDGKPGIHEDCGIQRFGGAFTDFAKKSFRLYFRAQYGAPKLKYPVFEGFDRGLAPVEEFDQLELRNCSHDMAMRGFYLSNPVTDDTLLAMGHLNPHGRVVHLDRNGIYWGVYHLRERWGASMHASYLGGSKDDYESINGNWNVGGWADPGTPYDGDGNVWKRIKSLRGSYREVRAWLDVPQYVDYMLMWMFGGAEDEYRAVGPTVPGDGMKFLLNDADGWFCGPWYCAADDRTQRNSAARGPGDGPGGLLSKLFAECDPEFRTLLADHIHRALFNGGTLTQERLTERLKARADELARPFLTESARWNYLTPAVWAQRRDYARTNWLTRRTTEVTGQWRSAGFYPSVAAPRLTVNGGVVSNGFALGIVGPTTGTVLYTTDGSDPRLPGGGVSPQAKSYGTGQNTLTLVPAGSRWRWYTDATGLGSSAAV